jgi:hypothetical protein
LHKILRADSKAQLPRTPGTLSSYIIFSII